MQIFTGPYLGSDGFAALKEKAIPGVHVERFTAHFPAWLQAADLSISMGGYNTTMNTLDSGTPALILPFSQNQEQRLRAEHLANHACLKILDEQKMSPGSLADNIVTMVNKKKRVPEILLDGAAMTSQLLTQWISTGTLP